MLLAKHKQSPFRHAEFNIEELKASDFKKACIDAKHSAGGLDNFTPADFSLLSDRAFDWLVELLNLVEQGADWPKSLRQARAAFLAKGPQQLEKPLAYRVLLILPVLYSRWAATRLKDLEGWIAMWKLDQMYAGVPEVGAEEGWWATALELELAQLQGIQVSGNGTDIFKCYDQLIRQLIYHVADLAGLPKGILKAYANFQEDLSIYNAIAGGLGIP